jgi:hypothetical protein
MSEFLAASARAHGGRELTEGSGPGWWRPTGRVGHAGWPARGGRGPGGRTRRYGNAAVAGDRGARWTRAWRPDSQIRERSGRGDRGRVVDAAGWGGWWTRGGRGANEDAGLAGEVDAV